MIKSMTGFGRGEYSDEISKVTVEIRSVNHRYLDIFVKMPRRYSFAEETIKTAIKNRVHRGKVEVSVSVDNIGKSDSDVRLDKELAARYYSALSELRDSFDFGEDSRVSFSLLAKMPDVIVTTPAAEDEDAMTAAFTEYTDKMVMREKKPSVLAALQKFKELVASLSPAREKRRERER